uniref:Vesicle transport protein n=1 Tax=Globodera pallida TaxID=36090 RepID=A0A183CMN5_GLOPA
MELNMKQVKEELKDMKQLKEELKDMKQLKEESKDMKQLKEASKDMKQLKEELKGMKQERTCGIMLDQNLLTAAVSVVGILSCLLTLLYTPRSGAVPFAFYTSEHNASDANYVLFLQFPWVEDLSNLSQPWALLLTSEALRKAALPAIFGGT